MTDRDAYEALREQYANDPAYLDLAAQYDQLRQIDPNDVVAMGQWLGAFVRSLNGTSDVVREALRITLTDTLKALGVRDARSLVRAAFKQRSPSPHTPPSVSRAPADADPDVSTDPVDGDRLLQDIHAFIERLVEGPPGANIMLAVFVVYSYVVDAFDTATYVAFLSPLPQSGKTRMLEVLELLVLRPWRTTVPTGPVLFRKLERDHPLLLLDEAEVVRGQSERALIVRAILQAGYRRGLKVVRCVGDKNELQEYDVFWAKVFAAIGQLPPALFDRCIAVPMRRRRRDVAHERFHWKTLNQEAEHLRRRLRRWAIDSRDALTRLTPNTPAFLNEREAESWEPLMAVAAVIGGEWPDSVLNAARLLAGAHVDDDQLLTLLLSDLRELFDERGADRLLTKEILDVLNRREDRLWCEYKGRPLTPQALAYLLRPLGIGPTSMRANGQDAKGYYRRALQDAFDRYSAPIAAAPPQPTEHQAEPVTSDPPHAPAATAAEPSEPPESGQCGGAAAEPTIPDGLERAPGKGDAWEPELPPV